MARITRLAYISSDRKRVECCNSVTLGLTWSYPWLLTTKSLSNATPVFQWRWLPVVDRPPCSSLQGCTPLVCSLSTCCSRPDVQQTCPWRMRCRRWTSSSWQTVASRSWGTGSRQTQSGFCSVQARSTIRLRNRKSVKNKQKKPISIVDNSFWKNLG